MLRRCLSISLILFTCSVCVSLGNTNTTNQPLTSTALDQSQTIHKEEPIDGHLYEFKYTLDFARELGFRRIFELLEEENYPAALQALDEKTGAGFQWSTEATNGYQYGFFVEALKGICLEKMGEIVKAYRAYQNSRYYCDEEKVSMLGTPYPTPKLEVYVGIGRMCNEAGRWTDSLNYLDSARMEAVEFRSIAVAADRALIERAVEIGDYKEAILLYYDIDIIKTCSKEEYVEYAKLLFATKENNRAISYLLNTIKNFGIDNELGLNDPIVKCFIENITKANEYHISLYFDILQENIKKARAVYGDENYLANIILIRKLLSHIYDNLICSNDFMLLKNVVSKKKATKRTIDIPQLIIKRNNNSKNDNKKIYYTHSNNYLSCEIDVMLMNAELLDKKDPLAQKIYINIITNINAKNIMYDSDSCKTVSIIEYNICQLMHRKKFVVSNMFCNNIIKYNEYLIDCYIRGNFIPYDIEEIISELPEYNKTVIKYIRSKIMHSKKTGEIIKYYYKYLEKTEYLDPVLTKYVLNQCAYNCNISNYVNIILCAMEKAVKNKTDYKMLDIYLLNNYSWANDEELSLYNMRIIKYLLRENIYELPTLNCVKYFNLKTWINKYKIELQIRDLYEKKRYKETLYMMNSNDKIFNQSGHLYLKAQILYKLGEYDLAFDSLYESYRKRINLANVEIEDDSKYPTFESTMFEKYIKYNNKNNKDKYIILLEHKKHFAIKSHDTQAVINITVKINSIKDIL